MRSASRAALLAILVGACGGGSADPAENGGGAASIESRGGPDLRDAPATPALPPPPSADAAEREAPNRVTVEYLTGRWCFHRESRDGEAGIIEFDPDGTNRIGIYQVWTQDEYRWDATENLAGFRRGYPEIVDIEPDRFVGIMRGGHRVVFERETC
jgi:hypothetical protein